MSRRCIIILLMCHLFFYYHYILYNHDMSVILFRYIITHIIILYFMIHRKDRTMKKYLSIFISVLFIISLSINTVSADTQALSGLTVSRGSDSAYVSNVCVYKSSSSSSYCVNLVSCSAAGVQAGSVGSNSLIFRPYHDGVSAANAVNFYGTSCSANGNRLYGNYYTNLGNSGWYYSLKSSLSSVSVSSTISYSIRWNP